MYQDDITVTGKNVKEHVNTLKCALNKLQTVGLKLNINKCKFLQEKVSYLGFTIDKYGLHKNSNRYQSFINCPIPNNITHVRAFIGMTNHFLKFISYFTMKIK